MRIAYVVADRGIPVFGDKGASIHVREMVGALAGLGHQVTLVAAEPGTATGTLAADLVTIEPGAGLELAAALRADARLCREQGRNAGSRARGSQRRRRGPLPSRSRREATGWPRREVHRRLLGRPQAVARHRGTDGCLPSPRRAFGGLPSAGDRRWAATRVDARLP